MNTKPDRGGHSAGPLTGSAGCSSLPSSSNAATTAALAAATKTKKTNPRPPGYIRSMAAFIVSPIPALMTKSAIESNGVGSRLIITSFAPRRLAASGNAAAG